MKKIFYTVVFVLVSGQSLFATPPHYVGELFGGGVIIWVDCSLLAEHGLIAALTDQSPVTGETWDQAVIDCAAYAGGGFHDWQLPTKEELLKLSCKAHHVPGGVVDALNETNESNKLIEYYWSSTTFDATHSYDCFMWNAANSGGNFGYNLKSTHHSARAVRSF